LIDGRSRRALPAEAAEIAIPHVIDEHEQEVWPFRSRRVSTVRSAARQDLQDGKK
jgi:hypothetical protein